MRGESVTLDLGDGAAVAMEIRTAEGGIANVGSAGPADFDNVVANIGPIGRAIQHHLRGLGICRASVTFGLSLAVKSGKLVSLITEGSGEGSLEITLEWDQVAVKGS